MVGGATRLTGPMGGRWSHSTDWPDGLMELIRISDGCVKWNFEMKLLVASGCCVGLTCVVLSLGEYRNPKTYLSMEGVLWVEGKMRLNPEIAVWCLLVSPSDNVGIDQFRDRSPVSSSCLSFRRRSLERVERRWKVNGGVKEDLVIGGLVSRQQM